MSESLKQRIITAIIIGIPILFMVFFNDMTRVIFLSLILILCALEFLSLHYKDHDSKFVFIVPSILVSGIVLVSSLYKFEFASVFLYIGVAFNIVLIGDLFLNKRNILSTVPWLKGIAYTSIPLSSLLFISNSPLFSILLLGSLFMIWISDIGAYAVGKSIGKNKLMPSVSPGKSWEGFIGAGVISLLASYIFYRYLGHLNITQWGVMALIVWLTGSIGDLVESKMKRYIGVKDSGTILPGHGGFLDRFDGFYFCLPFVLLYFNLIDKI
jgi:phosphatidate cytidylyltransferase